MKLKSLLLIVTGLVLASVAVYWGQRPALPAPDDPRVGQPLLDPALVASADRVRIADQGKTVELVRQPDGSWRVPAYFDFPADFSKLGGLMNELTTAKLKRLVTTRPDRLARLEFRDSAVTLLAKDRPVWSMTFGKTADYGERFVRFGDEPKAYLAGLGAWLDVDAKNWADKTVLALKPEEIKSVEIAFPDASAQRFAREAKGQPFAAAAAPVGKTLDTGKVDALVRDFASVTWTDTSEPGSPDVTTAREHARTIKFTTFAGHAYTLSLGRRPESKKPKPPTSEPNPAEAAAAKPDAATKPAEPEMETVPAGPVFLAIATDDPGFKLAAQMERRALQISDWAFERLPAKPEDFWKEAAAPTVPATATKEPGGARK